MPLLYEYFVHNLPIKQIASRLGHSVSCTYKIVNLYITDPTIFKSTSNQNESTGNKRTIGNCVRDSKERASGISGAKSCCRKDKKTKNVERPSLKISIPGSSVSVDPNTITIPVGQSKLSGPEQKLQGNSM